MDDDGFKRLEYECPACGVVMGEYAERWPGCGQNLFEVYSGAFTPGAGRMRSTLSWLLLGALGLALVGAVVGGVARLLGDPPSAV